MRSIALLRYYEWKQVDKREKQPYYFYREGCVMKVWMPPLS